MIILKSIPDYRYIELNRLTDYEIVFFCLIVLLLILVYFKKRLSKKVYAKDNLSRNQEDIVIENHDILMQEKQVKDDTIVPFTNFSLDWYHIGISIVLFIIFCYLIF